MTPSIHIYNTLTRKKELFEPLNPPFVGLYVCGPTVYSYPHLGNVRTGLTFDIVFRYLKYLGYKVRYVRNITDVGHLEGDGGDQGEDKIAKKARAEQLEPMEVVQYYTNNYRDVMQLFNMLPPSIEPTATGHLIEQMDMVQRIMENGLAYESNGSVYFDVKKYQEKHNYGKLSGRKVDELLEQTRDLDGQEEKRFFADFAIWKGVGPEHLMRWKTPWGGEGVPGWHLECSVMSTKYLGSTFDIHGGGLDLVFPHHECEIAQSVGADGHDPVRYWMHSNMLTVNGVKMSKSLGNSFLPLELVTGDHPLLEKGYSPMVARFFMLQTHYSSTLDFSNEALQASEKGYQRLMEAMKIMNSFDASTFPKEEQSIDAEVKKSLDAIFTAMNDDFSTPRAIAALFDLSSTINKVKHEGLMMSASMWEEMKNTVNAIVIDVLGLKEESGQDSGITDGLMQLVLQMRKDARERKDWAASDKIRDQLAALKIQVKDGKDGASWSFM